MATTELWSIASSVVSVILAILAICLSIYFFVEAKNTELRVASSLAKIETQADSLQRINAKWMDRLTKYVTTGRDATSDVSISQVTQMLSALPASITSTLQQNIDTKSNNNESDELYATYIVAYFYIAQANYWSQYYLPSVADFDDTNEFHKLVKRIVDMSASDFGQIAAILEKCDQDRLHGSALSNFLIETKDFWRHRVRSSSDIFIAAHKSSNGNAG